MDQGFFALRDHRDMLAKARRELARLDAAPYDVDHVFNFFVTAYHVMDYVKAMAVPKAAVDALYADPDFELCQLICNKGKHLELRRGDQETRFVPARTTRLGKHRLGRARLGFTGAKYLVDGREVDLLRIGRDLVAKWEAFFAANGI